MDWSRLLAHAFKRQHESHNLYVLTEVIKVKQVQGVLWSGITGGSFIRISVQDQCLGLVFRVRIRVSFLSRPIHCKHLSLIESTTSSVTSPSIACFFFKNKPLHPPPTIPSHISLLMKRRRRMCCSKRSFLILSISRLRFQPLNTFLKNFPTCARLKLPLVNAISRFIMQHRGGLFKRRLALILD